MRSPEALIRLDGSPSRPATQYRDLDVPECWGRLDEGRTGRVGWSSGGAPQLFPVSYALYDGDLVFRTSPYGRLAELVRPTAVAFEVDEVDEDAGSAWSVVVHGLARAVLLPLHLTTLWARPDIQPWAPGTWNVFIAITPHEVTGRTVVSTRAG